MTTATMGPARSTSDIETFLRDRRLFVVDEHGMVRLPILVGGRLVVPSDITVDDAVAALGAADYAQFGDVQIVRQARMDPGTLRDSGRKLLFILPSVLDAGELCASSVDEVAADLAGLHTADVGSYLDRVGAALSPGERLHDSLRTLVELTADTPIAYLDAALSGLALAFDGATVLGAVDRELALGTTPGRELLDGWVAPAGISRAPGLTGQLSAAVHESAPLPPSAPLQVRAMPTRQLHITAGNSPMIPVISAVRGLGVKGAVTLKMPAGALAAGAALAVAMHAAGPGHPLTRHASVVYWQGGDRRVEDRLFAPGSFDRIVVWGAPAAVDSVRARAGLTKTLTFNPRYGASMIGAEALRPIAFAETVRRAATDALVWNQKACIASLVHYVEGDRDLVDAYATALTAELALWDQHLPSPVPAELVGRLRQARRGAMRHGRWLSNGDPRSPTSAVVVLDSAFDLAAHPASRVIAVRPVARLEDALETFHPGVSEVGIAPESRRFELRDRICARGVTGVPPLGDTDAVEVAGIPQDGMRAMAELVSWVTA
jgi:hypothetical protein